MLNSWETRQINKRLYQNVYAPTDEQILKNGAKMYIEMVETCFGVITIIKESTV
jgi:hypothetical protein